MTDPLIVTVAVRSAPVLVDDRIVTDPSPVPDAPLVMRSHDALEDAVQPQDAAADTRIVPLLTSRSKPIVDGMTITEQLVDVAAAWVTVTARPATVTVADRDDDVVFRATERP